LMTVGDGFIPAALWGRLSLRNPGVGAAAFGGTSATTATKRCGS